MASRVTERLLNLTICLLSTRRALTRDRIRETVEGYAGMSDGAFERMFERDKDALRGLGVPIEVSSPDPLFDDEPGYRIQPTDFELPELDLTEGEATAVALATRVWQERTWDNHTRAALVKLTAQGVEADPERLAAVSTAVAPGMMSDGPVLAACWEALRDRRRVRFVHRGETRELEPWRVSIRRGVWYVLGRDVDKDAERLFRLSRMSDAVVTGRVGSHEVPDGLRVDEVDHRLSVHGSVHCDVWLRRGRAESLRRRAEALDEPTEAGWSAHRLRHPWLDQLVADVAEHAPDAVVTAPPEAVQAWRQHLEGVGASHGA